MKALNQRVDVVKATAREKEFTAIIEKDEDGLYVASVLELPAVTLKRGVWTN